MKTLFLWIMLSLVLADAALQCNQVGEDFEFIHASGQSVFGVNTDHKVMRMCSEEWFKFSEQSMKLVKTGPSGVWGIDEHNKLYTYVGDKWLHFMDDVQQIDPRLPNMVFGIQKSEVFCVPKIPNKLSLSSHRLNIMNIELLTCTKGTCWYLNNSRKEIYLYSYEAPCIHSNKEGQIKFKGNLKYIEANEEKQILALDTSGKVFFK
uniref:uncharacterized protein n=1 Tax=Myxine glutinosa TaxID=7769 RepID=UPI00358E927A